MDAFYAAVEVLADPSLAGTPLIVGGTGSRGVVASCSYEARSYGIHSAMPSMRAKRLCPHAVFVPGRYDLYQDHSRRLHRVLTSFTPLVEGIALDEAFLDVTGARRLWGPGPKIAAAIRARVHAETGLWCSVGVATSKFLAKLASEAAKPRAGPPGSPPSPGLGVKVVGPGEELGFLHPLPVGALWGVGPATRKRLDRFGIRTVGDLAAMPEATLVGALGEAHGRHLHALAWAGDDRAVEPDRAAKSVGHEETYAADHHRLETLRPEALRLSDAVANRLREAGVAGRTVTLKVRFGTFETITRSRTVPVPVDAGPAVARVAMELLDAIDPSPGIRLLGVSVSNLGPRPAEQLRLDGERADPEPAVAQAVDEVRRRFGERAVGPATLLREDGLAVRRRGDQQWGPSLGSERRSGLPPRSQGRSGLPPRSQGRSGQAPRSQGRSGLPPGSGGRSGQPPGSGGRVPPESPSG
jgi:DNA polymerase-4